MQILDQILVVFGPKIPIFMGVSKSFDTRPHFCPAGGLVGGCDARAVSRNPPIYFMILISEKAFSLTESNLLKGSNTKP